MSLGEQLRDQARHRIEVQEQAARRAEAEVMRKAAERQRGAVDFLERVKSMVAECIAEDRPLKEMKIPRSVDDYGDKVQISYPGHPNHSAWQDFEVWLTENDLTAEVSYRHDGMGMESWHSVTVTAAPSPGMRP